MTAHKIKMADIAAKLDTTTTTIGNWIGEFGQFFSPGAKLEQGKRRDFTDDDLIVLATIAKLSHDGQNYGDIRQQLADGVRVDSYEAINYGVSRTLIPEDAISPLIEVGSLKTELEFIRSERDRLADELKGKNELIDQLYKQVADLSGRAGKAEGRLEQVEQLQQQIEELKRQLDQERNKRRGWFL